jgi:hypothetical protein
MSDEFKITRYIENEPPKANKNFVEVVRCGECKYCVNGQCWKSDGLDKLDGNVDDDDFCSRGESEGE